MIDEADDNDDNIDQVEATSLPSTIPASHYTGHEFEKRFAKLQHSLMQMPPEVRELFYAMRQRMDDMERDSRDFVPRAEIEKIADARTRATLQALGFNMKQTAETAAQVAWLMGLKRSVRGFMLTVGAAFVTLVFTVFGSWITSFWNVKGH